MANNMTIDDTPSSISAAYRPIVFNVSSGAANIRGIRGDLYVGGFYLTTIDGVQHLGSSEEFSFDIRKIMQSVLTSELRTNITTFQVTDATDSAKTIKMRFFEILESSGVFTTDWDEDGAGTNYLESSDYNVVNMATQHQEDITDWTDDTTSKKLLTLRSDNNRITRGVPFQVGFLSNTTNFRATLETLDENLNVITTNISISLANLTSGKGIIEIPASLFSGSNVAFFDLSLRFLGSIFGITYRYKVVDVCNKFTIFFQNHLGGFDHFEFGNKVVKTIKTNSQKMKKPLTSGFSSEDAGIITINTNTNTNISVQTSALSASELTFIQELVKNHTVVYKWDSAGNFLRYTVESHSVKLEDNDELINTIGLVLRPSNEHISQKGD